jgi:hypothetical protein
LPIPIPIRIGWRFNAIEGENVRYISVDGEDVEFFDHSSGQSHHDRSVSGKGASLPGVVMGDYALGF